MIRSNPTAIPLRASDVKHLQSELDKRKPTPVTVTTTSTEPTAAGPSTNTLMAKGNNGEAFNAVDEAKKDRQGRSLAERIGL